MNWLKAVGDASTVQALLAVVNDYILAHPDEHESWIPRESRPTLVADAEELHHWHRKLSDDLAAATSAHIHMQDLCVFFLRAAARALELEPGEATSSNERQFAGVEADNTRKAGD